MLFAKLIPQVRRAHQAFQYAMVCTLFLFSAYTSSAQIKVEAESGSFPGLTVSNSPGGYSGSGYVSGFTGTQELTLVVNANSGLYNVSIRYTSPYDAKGYDMVVNGEGSNGMFAGTGNAFGDQNAGKVLLNGGANTIKIGKGWGYFGIDYVLLTPTAAPLPAKPPKQLIDGAANNSTRGLHSYLIDNYGSKVLSGQFGVPELDYVVQKTGKEAAVGGFDLMDYSPSRRAYANNADPGLTEQHITWAKKNEGRGIVSLVWHWNAPTDLIDQPGKEWWRGFYKDATTFDLAAALANKSGAKYQLIIRDIDAIAVELKKYRDNDIPVMFRPLHEVNGNSDDASGAGAWFWWGAKGGAAFKELWQILYDRMTNFHQLHNLIWVYTGTTHPNWYPGDQYIDMLGLDIYSGNQYDSMSPNWDNALAALNGKKLVSLSESGTLPVPNKIRAYGTWWSWFAMWGGTYLTDRPVNELQALYNDVDVITRDELPNWRTWATGGTRSPFAGVIQLPGTVEAENFDNGGEGVSFHDTTPTNLTSAYRSTGVDIEGCSEGGYNLDYSDNGEWTEYTVNVASSGAYTFGARVSSPFTTGSFHINIDGANVTGATAVPNTGGWQNWQTVTKTVNLTAGQHIMRFVIDAKEFNTNKFTFTANATAGIVSGQVYRLVNRNSGQVLEVGGAFTNNGANVNQWPWNTANCQRWKFTATDNGYFVLTAQHSGQALEIGSANMANGATANQWPTNGCFCQQWKPELTTNGYYRLVARHSGQVLEIGNASVANGAQVNQWPWNGATCQQWAIEAVTPFARQATEEVTAATTLKLAPNPASDFVNISWEGLGENALLTLVNTQGQTIHQVAVKGSSHQLRTGSISNGLYIISVQADQKTARIKFAIEH